jgi:DNA-directed RNA polymerase subunit RPC12/RpoP
MANVKKIEYKCLSCGALDQLKCFEDEHDIPTRVNCAECGSGRSVPVDDQGKWRHAMDVLGVGMRPTGTEIVTT